MVASIPPATGSGHGFKSVRELVFAINRSAPARQRGVFLSEAERVELARLRAEEDIKAEREARELVAAYRSGALKVSERQKAVILRMWGELDALDDFRFRVDKAAAWRRNKRKREATPEWADEASIDEIYERCRKMNLDAGEIRYHVDHVVPLQGRKVSGLHVAGNLRIITKRENLKKGNRFTVE